MTTTTVANMENTITAMVVRLAAAHPTRRIEKRRFDDRTGTGKQTVF
jgi:hypothetical protein